MADATLSHRLFDQAIEDNAWPTLVAEAVDIIETDNQNFWRRGDLCLRVDRSYGEGSMKKFATETGLGATKSLYEAAQIADFFKPDVRAKAPSLRREHWRQAFRAVNKAVRSDIDKLAIAVAHLVQAEDKNWSAAKMKREMRLFLGERATEHWVFEPLDIRFEGGQVILVLTEDEQQRVQEALAFKGKPSFKATLRISVEHEPEK